MDLTADGRVVLAGQDRLAGSALRMDRGIANLMRLAGLSLADAVRMATANAARAGRVYVAQARTPAGDPSGVGHSCQALGFDTVLPGQTGVESARATPCASNPAHRPARWNPLNLLSWNTAQPREWRPASAPIWSPAHPPAWDPENLPPRNPAPPQAWERLYPPRWNPLCLPSWNPAQPRD